MTDWRRETRAIAALLGIGLALGAFEARCDDRVFRVGLFGLTGGHLGKIRAQLENLGYQQGKNVVYESSYAAGSRDALPRLAEELVGLNLDVIFADATAAQAILEVSAEVPIVALVFADPVELGLAEDLSRPGGTLTGVVVPEERLNRKRLQLLRELAPNLERVCFIWDPTSPENTQAWHAVQRSGAPMQITLESVEVGIDDEAEEALELGLKKGCQALLVTAGDSALQNMRTITAFAAKHRLPAVYPDRFFTDYGGNSGLISYGPETFTLREELALVGDRVLKGTKPAEIPFTQISKFDLHVRRDTARLMSLKLPRTVLDEATKVIE